MRTCWGAFRVAGALAEGLAGSAGERRERVDEVTARL